MNRNPIIPFVLIMALGIGLMFFLSFKGLGDSKDLVAEHENGGKKTEEKTASADPEGLVKQSCVSCHGADLSGSVGPALKGVGDRKSQDEIKEIIKNGTGGGMPGGLVPDDQIDGVAKYLAELK
ncbi:cytochrome C [Bacillus sp. M6-12]|uniref:cytochrome c550 n=1 Tax=Bacillus sp. M6-12 TaxID=2054166 RepID=UPI000C76FE5C|nr:cytochrome c [Bacillus sp. M6-12]PLS15206.1 cytochrome C [Bacillus sp. M6-12]